MAESILPFILENPSHHQLQIIFHHHMSMVYPVSTLPLHSLEYFSSLVTTALFVRKWWYICGMILVLISGGLRRSSIPLVTPRLHPQIINYCSLFSRPSAICFIAGVLINGIDSVALRSIIMVVITIVCQSELVSLISKEKAIFGCPPLANRSEFYTCILWLLLAIIYLIQTRNRIFLNNSII